MMAVTLYFATVLVSGGLLGGLLGIAASLDATSVVRWTNRSMLIVAFLLAPLLVRQSGAAPRVAVGFGERGPPMARAGFLGLALGCASFLPFAAMLLATGARVPASAASAGRLVEELGDALATGLVVGTVEEVLFRGIVYSALRARSPAAPAILGSSLLYALAHFLRPESGGIEGEPTWYSGFLVIGAGLARFGEPATLAGDFLALAVGGVALALVRERTGHVGLCIGLHAAWVVAIKMMREVSHRAPGSELAWVVGSFDGVIGYLAAAWIGIVTLAIALRVARRAA